MFKRVVLTAAAVAAASLVAGSAAQADPITSLYNTGVDASGTPLADATIGDPHYALVGVPGGTSEIRVRTLAGGYPIPPYLGDDALSAWIGPNNDSAVDGPNGSYDYRTTFDLTGFDPSTAFISGGWSSDNNGLQILLNGVDTGNASTDFAQFSIGFAPFSITGGFVSGINTLDFIVNNGGGPTALRVEMSGDAKATGAVPEPGTWALMISGFGLAGAALRRRRTAVAA
jgi:PEP-CTERM motif